MLYSLRIIIVVLVLAGVCFAGISVTSPVNNSTVSSPVHLVASATSGYPITYMMVYVDGGIAWQGAVNGIDTSLSIGTGWHSIVVQAWDSTGMVQKAALAATVTSAGGAISVSSPANGATVGSPVQVVASGSNLTAMHVYVDGTLAYQVDGSSVNTPIGLSTGWHSVVVQGWDRYGNIYKSPLSVNASGSGSVASGGTTVWDIDHLTGWQSCTVCAGIGGAGPTVPYSMTQFRSTPSMDGKAAEFWVGGSTPYGAALWWKQLTPQPGATKFAYDLWFYYVNPNAVQALEFDLNQSVNGQKYIFGTQCNVRDGGVWDVWDTRNLRWVHTSVPCPAPPTYRWNHLVLEFERVNGQAKFVSITLNDAKSYVNWAYWPLNVNANELNVAFQMDGNYAMEDYSMWLDKVSLTYR